MASLLDRLSRHAGIGLDTCIFIYHFEAHPDYVALTRAVLNGVQEGRWNGVTSTVTLMDLIVKPLRLGQPAVAREYETLLINFPHLSVTEITREVARHAAQLRAEYQVNPADALQAATALSCGATAFVTNDKHLSHLSPTIDVVPLDQFLAG